MMKLLGAALIALLLLSCQAKKPAATVDGSAGKSEISHAFGLLIGTSIKSTSVPIDIVQFIAGVKEAMAKDAPKADLEKANTLVQTAIGTAAETKAKANIETEAKYLATNGKKAGVVTTQSGLQYEILTPGSGAKPKATDTVKVDYVGKLLDGSTFDSSIDRGEPAEIPLDRVIPGWAEGIQLMGVGSKFKFTIPSSLGYGMQGSGSTIPPNSTLVFEVTLISIEAAPKN
jgi:FKBP-type peptidyl-prolyl cis-trans isomerase FkpA